MKNNNYVVYFHEKKSQLGNVFYCGSGNPLRPYEHHKSRRNDKWHDIANTYGVNIHIIGEHLSKESARCLEGFLTLEWQQYGMCEANINMIPINGSSYFVPIDIKDKIKSFYNKKMRQKLSEKSKGERNNFYGKKHTLETISILSSKKIGVLNVRSKPISAYANGILIGRYESANLAASITQIGSSKIAACARKERKSSGVYDLIDNKFIKFAPGNRILKPNHYPITWVYE